ncbi:DNA cytosine methyltransferase [Kitasatospora sp. NPDC048194]|uniref:DNA cytosine methyltransferase n=1 Tax=Kitasatospora sp. NPDC048194 TaxID=3364045 RepID=UPI0037140970
MGEDFPVLEKGKYGVPLERSVPYEPRPHKDSCKPEDFAAWLEGRREDELLAVDLFSGAGGLSLGLERAGWTVAAAVDHDTRALQTHAANFPGLSLDLDLGSPTDRDRLFDLFRDVRVDLVAGGPPCQPYSRAGRSKIRSLVSQGKRDREDLRKQLWKAYLEIVITLQPRAVLMENVPDMGLGDDFFVVRRIQQDLEEAGYVTEVRLVDAWKYGVPQHRKRLILLARNDVDEFTWPAETEITTLRDAISDLPGLGEDDYGDRRLSYTMPKGISDFAREMRKGTKGVVWDHMTRRVRPDDKIIFQHMESDTLYSDLPEQYQRYNPEQFTDKYKKLAWDELSRTITAHIAKDGYWYIHPEQIRTLTVREAARVQTFPDRFRFAGGRSDAFRQIGNAVPPFLGEAAARALRPVEGGEAPEGGLKPYWLEVRQELSEWAKKKRRGSHAWFLLPGKQLKPLHAAVVSVLAGSRAQAHVAGILDVLRRRAGLDRELFEALLERAPTAASRKALERLEPVVDNDGAWDEPGKVPDLLGLKPAETSLYRLLINEDLLLAGQGPVRVAARVNGSEDPRKNQLSDGRVSLAKIVGAGEDAPLRMAAIRLIGMSLCREKDPLCFSCPLRERCVEYGRRTEEQMEPEGERTRQSRSQLF